MKISMKLAFAAGALAAAAPALATNGMRMIGFGPVQNSMGGAGAAAALDATSMVTNPAGLTALERRVDLSGTAFMPSPSYEASWTPDGANVFSAGKDSDRPVDFIPTLATVYRASDRLSVGVAALGTAGMGVDYGQDLYGSSTMTSYINVRVAPAVAYKFGDRLSVGIAANLMYAQMEYDVGAGMGMPPRDAAGAFGLGATLGVTYQAPEGVALALAYESKSYFQDFEFDIPAHTLQGVFPIPGGTEKLDFDQPDILTLGAAFRPVKPLLVAADVQWIRWTRTNGQNLPVFDTDPAVTGAQTWNLDWSDQLVLKIGGQLDVTSALKVRAGYNWGANPLHAERAFENVAFPAISEHHFTVGAGYDVGKLTVNASVMYSPEATLSGSNPAQGILAYETKMSQLSFDLGAAWKF